jgi:hypothetical protein
MNRRNHIGLELRRACRRAWCRPMGKGPLIAD